VIDEWIVGAPKGGTVVDLSTNAPAIVRELGQRVTNAGCRLLEAPLTGGAPGAKARTLVFMVGGEVEVFEFCRPVLESLSRAVFHLGPLGAGNTAKLVNSLMAFTCTWVSLEGLAIADKGGIPPRSMVDVVRTGGASNFFIDQIVEAIGERGRPTEFALALAAKDAGLIEGLAEDVAVPAPVARALRGVLDAVVASGLGDHDWSDLVEYIDRTAGVHLSYAAVDGA
jgi:3-hydroxyisobutyrate dehydrogenase-like beta-hydroxyacid dehydrogenase